MNNFRKRTFSQFQEEDGTGYIDNESAPKQKKQKISNESHSSIIPNEQSSSPSIEIISVYIPHEQQSQNASIDSKKILQTDNKENNGDINNSNSINTPPQIVIIPNNSTDNTNNNSTDNTTNTNSIDNTNPDWINDNDSSIIEHRLEKEWIHFKIVSTHNNSDFLWLKHEQLKHLNIYAKYLKQNNLLYDEVSEPQYVIEQILDHQYNEETDKIEFNIKWKGYTNSHNTWEPHKMLKDNELYITYCKNNGIKPMLTASSDENDDDDEFEDTEYEEETVETADETVDDTVDESGDYIIDNNMNINHVNNNNTNNEMVEISEIDIESEYTAAKQQTKQFSAEYIECIKNAIDGRMQMLFEESPTNNNSNNTNNSNNNSVRNVETELNTLMDIREYFDTMKGELLFKQFQKNENKNNKNNNNIMDIDNYENDTMNDIINEHNSDDDVEIIEKVNTINVKTPQINKTKKQRKTLFDYYSFTPIKSKTSNTNNISNKKQKRNAQPKSNTTNTTNSTKKKKTKKKPKIKQVNTLNVFGMCHRDNSNSDEKDEIPMEYIRVHSTTCYSCKRKWSLSSIECLKAFPMCNKCPTNMRLGHNRKLKEDWFCPYCCHSAKCVLFPSIKNETDINCNDNFGTNGVSLTAICNVTRNATNKPYLYIKPNGSNYWKTYFVLKVNNEQNGNILVRDKKNKSSINIILSNIAAKNILWAYNDNSTEKKQYGDKDISSLVRFDNTHAYIKMKKKSKPIAVEISQIIMSPRYLNKRCTEISRQCKKKGITFDRAVIFKYSRSLKEKRDARLKKKHKFGANTIVKESAPLNSRYFNENNNDIDINDNNVSIPNYPNTTQDLLSYCNLSSVPENMLSPPKRELRLQDIEKYSLVLIVGPSGCGKSTLLRSLQQQNPSLVTFNNPDTLEWNPNKCIISQFDKVSIETAMSVMSSIGLNNVRKWLQPCHIQSAGEQYRCGTARNIVRSINKPNHIILMDEWTSVLDRTSAQTMSSSFGKCVRKNNKKYKNKTSHFILASANADIIRYLQPDLLILLGGENEMKFIENPNDSNTNLFDVKCVLDLPPFTKKKGTHGTDEHYKSISKLTTFDDLKPLDEPITVDNIVRELKCKVDMDSYAKQTSTILDVEDFNGECVTHIPCLQKKHIHNKNNYNDYKNYFNIGIIVGPSGSGKTTTGERLFGRPQPIKWDCKRHIASHFQCITNLKELFAAVHLPLSIGLSYYNNLSEGEQHRVNIARYLDGNDNVLIDEFTSYLDRDTAKKVAKGVSDYIYQHNKKNIVILSCKYDIISRRNGMYPTWIFDIQNKKITHYKPPQNVINNSNNNLESNATLNLYAKHQFIDIKNLWNPPKIRLVLKQSTKYDFSPTFAKYHYMDASISASARCYSVWAYFDFVRNNNNQPINNNNNNNNNSRSDKEEASDSDEKEMDEEDMRSDDYYNENELQLVGFISLMNHYGRNNVTMADNTIKYIHFREHRTVILPSFQGLGFGSRIADCMGEYLALHGLRLHSKTAHPRYGGYRNKQPSLWIPTQRNNTEMARSRWQKDIDRMLYGGSAKVIGQNKKYYVHVFKLYEGNERTNQSNKLLKKRVIVKKKYKTMTDS